METAIHDAFERHFREAEAAAARSDWKHAIESLRQCQLLRKDPRVDARLEMIESILAFRNKDLYNP